MITFDELEQYFRQHPVQAGTILNKAAKIIEPDKFIKVNIDNAGRCKGDIHKCPSYWHLCELYCLLSPPATAP